MGGVFVLIITVKFQNEKVILVFQKRCINDEERGSQSNRVPWPEGQNALPGSETCGANSLIASRER